MEAQQKSQSKEVYSHSKLWLYDHCPQCYFFKYELKVQSGVVSPNLVLGTAIHHVNEGRINDDITFEAARDILKKELLLREGLENPEEVYTLAEKMAKALIEDPEAERYPIKETERSFILDLDDFRVRGYIDGLMDGMDWIYEFKTSKYKYSEESVKEKWQWGIYALAYRDLFAKIPEGILYHIIYKSGAPKVDWLPIRYTEEDLDNTEDYIRRTVVKIRSGYFEPTRGACETWCDYKDLCPNI